VFESDIYITFAIIYLQQYRVDVTHDLSTCILPVLKF
jgi:hypothetical protein